MMNEATNTSHGGERGGDFDRLGGKRTLVFWQQSLAGVRQFLKVVVLLTVATTATPVFGQDALLDSMTEEICECLRARKSRTARQRAELCLQRASGKRELELARRFGVNVRQTSTHRVLTDTLAVRLSEQCTELVRIVFDDAAPNRWTDAPPPTRGEYEYTFASPSADLPAEATPGELPILTEYTGRLTALNPEGLLVMRTDDGKLVEFQLPTQIRQQVIFAIGLRYRLTGRRVLSITGDRMDLQVVDVLAL